MYEAFFGFREKPFHVTADPAFLYPSRQHQEAMAHMLYGIRERLGFIMVTGEVGTGKTTLSKALVQRLEGPVRSALILNPTLSATELLRAILRDFGLDPAAAGNSRGDLLVTIEGFLLQQAQARGNVVLIIDEAQALSTSTLEQVRLLSNVETAKTKLLQIILVGQPELSQRLARDPRLRALRQRIAVHYQVQPLEEDDVAEYIRYRLQTAGSNGSIRFTQGALASIARIAQGFPRQINLLCDQALVAAFVRESREIDESMVAEASGMLTTATN